MTDEKLISKKDVLRETGISYGQLYRWKRKGLIPEGWFVRKSTFTGQETFFPEDRILERIGQILELKDDHALDDLATAIGKRIEAKLQIAASRLERLGWTDDALRAACGVASGSSDALGLEQALCLGVLSQLRAEARDEELTLARRTLENVSPQSLSEGDPAHASMLFLLRKRVAATAVSAEVSAVVIGPRTTVFDPELAVVDTIDLRAVLEKLQLDLAQEAP